jgi:PKD repeat protein
MKARFLVSLCAIGAAITVASCSKGLGNNPTNPIGDTSPVSTNRPVGLDIGLQPTDPITETCSTGVVVPAIGSFPERDIVLLAFTTASDAINADGAGTPLSRDYVLDGNAASDVFVASICSQDVDTSAFSQSLAGKFRHPRCTTCHSMQADDTNAFVSSAISVQLGGSQPHLGPVPGSAFPNNSPEACAECHDSQDFTTFPVKDWQAPAVSFDLRTKSVQELAIAAGNVPSDEPRHFVTDPRVLWALDSGILPTRGGRNGVADDDHDGIDEASDRDGVIRTVPGGSAVFLQQIEEWGQGGFVTTAADAVCDITLVSRAAYLTAAGNGASSRPQVTWEANSNFSAPGRVGTLFIVFQSDATDLISGDNNGATDIFRTAVDLVSDSAGNLDLVANGNAVLVSAINGDTTVANGGSTMATVGGMDGNMVAFQSIATDLVTGFGDTNGPNTADVYVRNIATNSTELISHEVSNVANGGNGESANPAIDATGSAIAFESNATDMIVADTNGLRDVFYTDISGGNGPFLKVRASLTSAGGEGTGGASGNASIYVAGDGRTLVAYESDKTDLAPSLTATTNVYVFDSNGAGSTLLNQQLSSKSAAIGDGSARNPVISADGANIAFESDATNIDFLRPNDDNGSTDIFLVGVAEALDGTILPHRFSVTTIGSADGDGNSTEPSFGTFSSPSSTFGVGFATYTTAASNLGTPSTTDIMVAFLDETFGVLADFTATPTPTTGAIPLAVQFTDISVGTPTAWQWDFDNDGTVDSTEQNPSFTYTTGGMFTVALTASNDVGSDAVTKSDLVVAVGPPTADFSATPTSGPASLAVQFTDTSTGSPTSWSWDFGDGNSSTQQSPMHTYAAVGTYTVALTATNTAGSATETKSNFIEVFTPVVAGFTPSVTSGTVSFPVTFTNTSTGATSYVWDFGDGSATVTTESPTHTYTSSGTFTATLTSTGPGGTDSTTETITANGVVTASFTVTISAATVTSGYSTSTVTLDASGSANATTYQWDLDNNSTIDRTGVTVTDTVSTLFPIASPNVAPFSQNYTIRLIATGPGGSSQVTQSFTAVAATSTVTISASQDSTIYSESSNGNGGDDEMVAGNAANLTPTAVGVRRALMEFDVAGNLPSGASVTAASLQLRCTFTAVTNPIGAHTFDLHRLTSGWTEGTSVAISAGIGAIATGGDVTWAESTSGSTPWGTAGGDFTGTISASRLVNATGSYTWASTATMVSNAQLWLDTPANNHGWILRGDESSTTGRTVKWFGTRQNGTPAFRPMLSVTFQRPL